MKLQNYTDKSLLRKFEKCLEKDLFNESFKKGLNMTMDRRLETEIFERLTDKIKY